MLKAELHDITDQAIQSTSAIINRIWSDIKLEVNDHLTEDPVLDVWGNPINNRNKHRNWCRDKA